MHTCTLSRRLRYRRAPLAHRPPNGASTERFTRREEQTCFAGAAVTNRQTQLLKPGVLTQPPVPRSMSEVAIFHELRDPLTAKNIRSARSFFQDSNLRNLSATTPPRAQFPLNNRF